MIINQILLVILFHLCRLLDQHSCTSPGRALGALGGALTTDRFSSSALPTEPLGPLGPVPYVD